MTHNPDNKDCPCNGRERSFPTQLLEDVICSCPPSGPYAGILSRLRSPTATSQPLCSEAADNIEKLWDAHSIFVLHVTTILTHESKSKCSVKEAFDNAVQRILDQVDFDHEEEIRRIVAAVNFCREFPTEWLEKHQLVYAKDKKALSEIKGKAALVPVIEVET